MIVKPKKVIYLSGPIDNCSLDEIDDWRKYLIGNYTQYEFINPYTFHHEFAKNARDTIGKEKSLIINSNMFVCYPWVPSTGTSMELMFAYMKDVPIVTISQPNTYISPWIIEHSDHVTDSFTAAFEWIEQFFDKV